MPPRRTHPDVRARVPRGRTGPAPVLVRVLLLALCAGPLAGAARGTLALWLALPLALLACALPAGAVAGLLAAALVMAAGVAALALTGGALPALWPVAAVVAVCALEVRAVVARLRRERDAMAHAAFSDPLTGVANRRMLLAMADYEIARHRRAREPFTLVMLDLDGFKLVNDRRGHAAGDQILRRLGTALTRTLRSQDTVARLGGDEFCVIAPQTAESTELLEKILAAVGSAAGAHAELAASVGTAVFPRDGASLDDLLEAADARLLAAKRRLYGSAGRRAA